MSVLRPGDRAAARPSHEVVCVGPRCHAVPDPDCPAPLCLDCAEHVWAFMQVKQERRNSQSILRMMEWSEARRAEVEQGKRQPKPAGVTLTYPGTVYFVRFRDRIKIGWSSDPDKRIRALPHDEVLHLQPGTIEDERRCHAAFAHLRDRGEWFRMEPDLVEFIDDLRRQAAA